MKSNYFLLVLLTVFFSQSVHSQDLKIEKKLDSIIQYSLQQNIFAKYILDKGKVEIKKNGRIVSTPCDDWKYNIKYKKKIDSILPNCYGLIIQISTLGCGDKKDVEYKQKLVNTMFGLWWEYKSSKILIAVNETNNEILYLAGDVIIPFNYASFFHLDKYSWRMNKLKDFLTLHFYLKDVEDIQYVKENKKWIYVSVINKYPEMELLKKVYYRINKEDFNDIHYLGWKISGKYKKKEILTYK